MWPCPPPPPPSPRNVRNRYTVKNGISNLYILLKSALKMQEMPFQRPKCQKISGEACPGPLNLQSGLYVFSSSAKGEAGGGGRAGKKTLFLVRRAHFLKPALNNA